MPTGGLLGAWRGWGTAVLVTVVAAVIRFPGLGNPPRITFDETYYAKDAYSLWHSGYEQNWSAGADDGLLAGTSPNRYLSGAEYVVHPPLGKWVIGIGEQLFGMNAFGWRFMTALIGCLSVLVLARVARRLTRSDVLGGLAGLFLAVDGLAVVMSRFALLDTQVAFWILCGVGALLCDRDWSRARLAAAIDDGTGRVVGFGPRMWWRPWRFVAGLCFALSIATKWNGVFAFAVFMVLSVAWDYGARKTAGGMQVAWTWFRCDVVPAFLTTVPLALVIYVASWLGWIVKPGGYLRDWADIEPAHGLATVVPGWLRSLWHYHEEIYRFHTTLTEHHPYQSDPWSWLIVGRPVAIATQFPAPGNCGASECDRVVTALGTPTLWWGGCVAIVACLVLFIGKRDWRFGLPVVALLGTWVPWFQYHGRPLFYFYAISIIPFMILAIVLVAGMAIGPPWASPDRRLVGVAAVSAFTVMVLITFWFFYPIYTYQLIPNSGWALRLWWGTWN
jgi:dolichyl-phosphate-mannose-protein mannosyltransferase